MRRYVVLVLLAFAFSTRVSAQQPDTLALGSITLQGVRLDTTLDLNRAGLSYRISDRLSLFDAEGRPLRHAAVRLHCATLLECKDWAGDEPEAFLPAPATSAPAAKWPLRVRISAEAEPAEYLIEVRDATGHIRPYRRLRLEPPPPRLDRVSVYQDGRSRRDTVLVDPREALHAELLVIGGPFYNGTKVWLGHQALATDVRGRDTLRVWLSVDAGRTHEVALGARRVRIGHPAAGTDWGGVDVNLRSRRAPRIDFFPPVVYVERGFHELVVQGADFSPEAQLCIRSGTYRLTSEGCLAQTRREGRTLKAHVDFGRPSDGFAVGDFRVYVRNRDGQRSSEVRVEVRPLDSTADAEVARTGDVVVAGVPTEIIFARKERARAFPDGADFTLEIGGVPAELLVEQSDVDRVRAVVTVPESAGGQTPSFDLKPASGRATWTGQFIPVARRPRLADRRTPELRRGGATRLVFSNGIPGRLVSSTDGVLVEEGGLHDGEATVRVTTAQTGSEARLYVQAGSGPIDSLDLRVSAWPDPADVVQIGTSGETAAVGDRPLITLSHGDPLRIAAVDEAAAGRRPRVDVILRRSNGAVVSDPISVDFGRQDGMILHPDLYGLSGGDRFNVEFRTPDGTIVRQQAYVSRPFLDRWSVSAGLSAIEYRLREPDDESANRGSLLSGVQIAAHYLLEFPHLEKRPFGVGTHVIASESEGRIGIRMAGSVLLFETLAVGVGGWREPFLFIGANMSFLDLSSLFRS